MAWGSALWRRMKVYMLALAVFLDYRSARKKALTAKEKPDVFWSRVHRRNADRILATITELEGLWVKFGQYLSTRADVLPEEYISSFRLLQDSMPPRPVAEVKETIETELGKRINEVFSEFDERALATASIAQVHRARMKDGRDVVVKAQHQGIKEIVLQDLHNAGVIVEWVAWAEPDYDFGPVLSEWCKELPKELDFNLEAESTRKVAANLKTSNRNVDQVDVLVPEVVQSTEKILILTYMDGVRLSDRAGLDRLGVDRQSIIETITRAYAHQIYIDGFFNADPHPGNFLVSTQPPFRPILLDFGLTKSITPTFKQSLAKMLLAAAEADYSALLSAFSEMGLVLKLDMPEEAMEITNFFFRRSLPAEESVAEMKLLMKENDQRIERLKSRMENKGTVRTPVAAFPSDAVFFMRVLGLLRGLSSMLDVKVIYIDIMKPYAEAVLWSERRYSGGDDFPVFDGPLHSQAELKLQQLLREMSKQQRVLGIQVCAYKDGKVVVDTAAGVHGKYDPRPVRPDSLFSVFSATKGVTAALIHWLADQGKFSLSDKVCSVWPDFAENNKEECTIAHVLNHTSGLQNALYDTISEDPLAMCNWDEMVKSMAAASPETPPGQEQKYHALTFGWLCGAIAEKSSGKSFQELLEEAFVNPLNVSGEFYIGIPPGVEERLTSLTLDTEAFKFLTALSSSSSNLPEEMRIPESMRALIKNGSQMSLTTLPSLFNMLFIRRALIPAANGHFSARALARFYAMLANGGKVPGGTSATKPPLGSHTHRPHIGPPAEAKKKKKKSSLSAKNCCTSRSLSSDFTNGGLPVFVQEEQGPAVFNSPDAHEAFLGTGEYRKLTLEDGLFGLGFRKLKTESSSESVSPFGHTGIGGSFGYCDPKNNFALAVTVNKMSLGQVTREIVQLVCSEVGVPPPVNFASAPTDVVL